MHDPQAELDSIATRLCTLMSTLHEFPAIRSGPLGPHGCWIWVGALWLLGQARGPMVVCKPCPSALCSSAQGPGSAVRVQDWHGGVLSPRIM